MARKIKFALTMTDGVEVHNLDDLREHFNLEKVIQYFHSGQLLSWLRDRYYDDEADIISSIGNTDPHLSEKLCIVFGVSSTEALDPEFMKRISEKRAILEKLTDDESILSNAKITAITQEDLADLLDMNESLIYLCGEKFNVPIRVTDKHYIGILGRPKIDIKASSPEELEIRRIVFENVILPWGSIATVSTEDMSTFEGCKRIAMAGNADAMYNLAMMYLNGENGAKNDPYAARDWFRRAADADHAEAIYMVGKCYAEGIGGFVDKKAALRWYKDAAEANSIDGMINLAGMYLYEDENKSPENYSEAVRYLYIAASLNNADAMNMLGDCYRYGHGTYESIDEAFRWYQKAAEGGNAAAQETVEELLSEGKVHIINDEDIADSDIRFVDGYAEVDTVISNKTGIHARPAAAFVQTASKYRSKIQVSAKGHLIDAKSSLLLMSIGLVKGTKLTIRASGPDSVQAVRALKSLIESKFGEEDGVIPENLKNIATYNDSSNKPKVSEDVGGVYEMSTVVSNHTGIHARPASTFVQTASKFRSKIQLRAKGKIVDAKSILMLMSIGLAKGTPVTIIADGPDAKEAVKTLKDLIDSKFGEE